MPAKVEKCNLKKMIEYHQNSIVSRTIVDNETTTVTLFAFDMGQDLSEHTAPYDAVVYLVEGGGEIAIDGERFVMNEGEMILMPADVPHALRAIAQFKMLLVMIRSQYGGDEE